MEVECIGNTQIIHMEETGITQRTIGLLTPKGPHFSSIIFVFSWSEAVNFQFSKSSKARFLCVLQPTPTEYIQYSPFLDLKLRVRMRLFQFFSDCELLVRESRQRFLKKAVKFQFLWLEIVNSPEV